MQEILIKIKNEVQNKYNFTPSNNIQLLVENLQKLKSKEGCYVELGTFRGSTLLSVAIATKLLNIDTELFGVDTFEGFPNTTINNFDHPNYFQNLYDDGLIDNEHYLSAKTRTDNFSNIEHLKPSYFQNLEGLFNKVKDFNNIFLIKSKIKNSYQKINKPIKVLFFDCDLYDSYMDGFKEYYENVISGGVLVFDEYYSLKYPGALKSVNDFLGDKSGTLDFIVTNEGFKRYFFVKN